MTDHAGRALSTAKAVNWTALVDVWTFWGGPVSTGAVLPGPVFARRGRDRRGQAKLQDAKATTSQAMTVTAPKKKMRR
jgi:hypothetical protein